MNSKQLSNVLIIACLIAMVVWWRWRAAEPPPKKPATVQTRPPRATLPPAAFAPDTPAHDDIVANMDPATLQLLMDAIAQQQQPMPPPEDAEARTEKTVLSNLRQLAAGSEQYFLESGRSSVASADLVGTNSTQMVKPFPTVAGETYTEVILQGHPVNATGVNGVRDISYGR
jgi:hypothetical protein